MEGGNRRGGSGWGEGGSRVGRGRVPGGSRRVRIPPSRAARRVLGASQVGHKLVAGGAQRAGGLFVILAKA